MVGDVADGVVVYDLEGVRIYDIHCAVCDVGDVDPFGDVGEPIGYVGLCGSGVDVGSSSVLGAFWLILL